MNIFTIYILLRILSVGDSVEGGKEKGEVQMVFTANMRHVWAVGWATSISEVYVMFMKCTYMMECCYAVSGQARARFWYLSHQLLNDTLNHMALTSKCFGDLENVPMDVWGHNQRRQGGRGS